MSRTIDDIKADISELTAIKSSDNALCTYDRLVLEALEAEFRAALTVDIPLDRLEAIIASEVDGRCVVLPKLEEAEYNGLKVKYRVFKVKDNTPVENCFVLRPDKDEAALYALMCYGMATNNLQLGRDILQWVSAIEGNQETEAALTTNINKPELLQ